MVFFNWATMQMAAKIVYYGPGLCGKTSNLSYIYAKTSPNSRGEMVSLETESDRTLFFDLLPIEVGTIGGFKTRLQLYTVPGQVFYNTTRKLVLKGVDGLVFVADSQRPMREANIESFKSLVENIEELNLDLRDLPLVLQYNKRDLKNILTIDELNEDLNPEGLYPFHPSSAINGEGVFETLKAITKFTLKKLRKRMASPQAEPSQPPRRITTPATPMSKKPGVISAASLAEAAEEAVGPAELKPPEAMGPPAPATVQTAVEAPVQSQPSPNRHQEGPETIEPLSAGEPFPEAQDPEPAGEKSPEAVDPLEKTAPMDLPLSMELEPDDDGDIDSEIEDYDEEPAELPPQGGEYEEEPEELQLEDAVDTEDHHEEPPEEEDSVDVEFETSAEKIEEILPPPVKRVHVSSQMDILSELEDLRRQTTESSRSSLRSTKTTSLDLDALLGGPDRSRKNLKRRVEKSLNSNIFNEMESVQLALRIVNSKGETIHTLDTISMKIENAESLKNLLLQLTIDLENAQRS